jgi:hypothetical protein
MADYTRTFEVNTKVNKIYHALRYEIPLWWTEMFEGSAVGPGDNFTVRFGNSVYKKISVADLVPDSKIVWHVEDSQIAVPGLRNQKEWIDTVIEWNLTSTKNNSRVQLIHIGLHPGIECYDICKNGWQQFTDSLKLHAETGKGDPFRQ